MKKAIFLDRDGVINKDFVDYAYTLDKFFILPGVIEAIDLIKKHGYLIVVVTNQSGIAKGIYTKEDMQVCHDYLQEQVNHQIDKIYYSPWHDSISKSLSRKPGTLMFEKAIAKFDIDVKQSWMIGDKPRDLIPAIKMGLKTIQVDGNDDKMADHVEPDLIHAVKYILAQD
ncbi:MAG: HAD family hydrolase [Cyclobacteriaceae bacterium]